MKTLSQSVLTFFLVFTSLFANAENRAGDTISIDGKKFKLLSTNLITNPGFDNGFSGWTDATTSGATLTSAKFNIPATGGVNNSSYLVGQIQHLKSL